MCACAELRRYHRIEIEWWDEKASQWTPAFYGSTPGWVADRTYVLSKCRPTDVECWTETDRAHLLYVLSDRLEPIGKIQLKITVSIFADSPRVFFQPTATSPKGLAMWVHLYPRRPQRYCYYDKPQGGRGFSPMRLDPQDRLYKPMHHALPSRRYITLWQPGSTFAQTLYPFGQRSKVATNGRSVIAYIFFNQPFAVETLPVPEARGEAFVQHRSLINSYVARQELTRLNNE